VPGLRILARAALDRTSLGNLLLKEKIVDHEKLTELLSEFMNGEHGGYFGQFLIKKGVLTREKLEFILIRQSASRSGGVEDHHVAQAKKIAAKTSSKLMDEVDGFLENMHKSLAEKGVQ